MARAASCMTRNWPSNAGKFGLKRTPIVAACGTSSRNRPSRLGSSAALKLLIPVMFPPGRLRLATKPRSTGSPPNVETIGIVAVAALAASAAGSAPTETSTALGVAVSGQPAAERGHEMRALIRRPRAEEPDHRHRRLLRVRGERPRRGFTAKKRYERAPIHSIT